MKKFMGFLLILIVALTIFTVIISKGKRPQHFPLNSDSATRLQVGFAEVLHYNELFIDETRPTMANSDYPGDTVRRLDGIVWYPSDQTKGPYPLIIFSHGFSAKKEAGRYLAEHLVSHGYVVAAVDFPLTSQNAPGGLNEKDVVNQPADISFLIDTLLAQNEKPGHQLYGMIDKTRIGAMGTSWGGLTSELLGFHHSMRDHRIGAVLSIAGPTIMFTKTFFDQSNVPFMMLAGDIDVLIPYTGNALPVLEKVENSQLITVRDGTHIGFSGLATLLRWFNNPDAVACRIIKKNLVADLDNQDWLRVLGTIEQGINPEYKKELCLVDPLPKAINVLRQQMISAVVTTSFFQSQFAMTIEERDAAQKYLSETMAKELLDVNYRRAP